MKLLTNSKELNIWSRYLVRGPVGGKISDAGERGTPGYQGEWQKSFRLRRIYIPWVWQVLAGWYLQDHNRNLLFSSSPRWGHQQLRFSRWFPVMQILSPARLSPSVVVVHLPDPAGLYEPSLSALNSTEAARRVWIWRTMFKDGFSFYVLL